MKAWMWNGAAYEPCAALPVADRGFRYGMAVFESIRVLGGEPEFLDRHVARLLSACAEREFTIAESPLLAAGDALRKGALELTHSPSVFARIHVTAGDGALTAAAIQPRILLLLEPRSLPTQDCYEITFHDEPYRAPFGGLKTSNYWFNADAATTAQRRGFDEALLFNDFAELVSATTANVFLVLGDRIVTPPRSSGTRAGVIREWVIARRKVEERRLRRQDVVAADEIFLTNSWIGVMPVATLEGRPLGPRRIGPKLASELAQRSEGR